MTSTLDCHIHDDENDYENEEAGFTCTDCLRAMIDEIGVVPSPVLLRSEAGFRVVTEADKAVELWERLRLLAPRTGYWPVLLGGDGELVRDLPKDGDPDEALEWSDSQSG
jgi:hypothetical protein